MKAEALKTVLILGARGRFGLAATRAFAAAGWRVVAQMRPGATAPDCPGATWLPVPVQDTTALVRAARGASVVVHALNPAYTAWETQALPLLEAGLRVAGQLRALMMLPGNVYNFGATMPPLLTEQTPQHAQTRKGRIRVAMEQHMQQAANTGAPRGVVIRAGDFFGCGTGSWFDLALAKDIRRGKMTYPGALDLPTAWAYLPDLAGAFVRTADRMVQAAQDFAPFEVFHFRGYSLSGNDWAEQLADVARDQGWLKVDARLKVASMPWPLIQLGARLVPMWRELAEMRYLWQTPHALAGDRLAALIGPEPHTPLPIALGQTLHDLGLLPQLAGAAPACA